MFKYCDKGSVLIISFFRIKSSTVNIFSEIIWHFGGLFSNRKKLFHLINRNMLINLGFIKKTFYETDFWTKFDLAVPAEYVTTELVVCL